MSVRDELRRMAEEARVAPLDKPLPIQRNLEQLLEIGEQRQAQQQNVEQQRNRAQMLLQPLAPDFVNKVERLVTGIRIQPRMAPLESLEDTDLDAHIAEIHKNIYAFTDEEAAKSTYQMLEQNLNEEIRKSWIKDKEKFLEKLNVKLIPSHEPVPGPIVTSETEIMEYASVIEGLNAHYREQLEHQEPYHLVQRFQQICASKFSLQNPENKEKIKTKVRCWKAIEQMTREKHWDSYTPTILAWEGVNSALSYLESFFWEEKILEEIARNPERARVGGDLTERAKLEGFARIKGMQDNYWFLIFHSIRAGKLDAANQFARLVDRERHKEFSTVFEEYARKRSLSESNRKKALDWLKDRQNNQYQTAVLEIISRKINDMPLHNQDTKQLFESSLETLLWDQLSAIRTEKPEDFRMDRLALLQRQISEGTWSSHEPLVRFLAYILTQQYERALNYLDSVGAYRVEVTHFAISLYYYGVLKKSSAGDGGEFVSVARLIRKYVSLFLMNKSDAAIMYYLLIKDQEQQCKLLRDLVVVGNSNLGSLNLSIAKKLVDFDPNGILCNRDQLNRIMASAAKKMYKDPRRWKQAARIYYEIEMYDNVLEVMSDEIDRAIQSGDARQRGEVFTEANGLYSSNPCKNPAVREGSSWKTFELMRSILWFFNLYKENRFEDALQLIRTSNLLPFPAQQDPIRFEILDARVKKALPFTILATMECLDRVYQERMRQGIQSDLIKISNTAEEIVKYTNIRIPDGIIPKEIKQRINRIHGGLRPGPMSTTNW